MRRQVFLLLIFIFISSCSSVQIQKDDVLEYAGSLKLPSPDKQGILENVPVELSLEESLKLAESNPDTISSALDVSAARANTSQASVSPNPRLGVSTENVSLEKPAWQSAKTRFLVSQEIELGGKRSARTSLAQKQEELAESVHGSVIADRELEVTLAFNKVLYVQEHISILKSVLDATVKLHEVANIKLKNGRISRREFLQFDIALNNAKLDYANGKALLKPVLAKLGAAIGINPRHFRTEICKGVLAGEIQEQNERDFLDKLKEHLFEKAPNIITAMNKMDVARHELKHQRARRWPNLTAGIFFAKSESNDENSVGASLSMPIPIWDANSGAVRSASERFKAAEGRLAQVQNELLARFDYLEESLLTARRSVDVYSKEIIPKASESYEIALAAFEGGRLSYVETIEPLISLLKVQKAHLDWLKQFSDTVAELRALAGVSSR